MLFRSAELDVDEQVTRRLGATEAVLHDTSVRAIYQDPTLEGQYVPVDDEESPTERTPRTAAQLADLLPDGARALPSLQADVAIRTAAGSGRVELFEMDVADPAYDGKFTEVTGRAPRARDELMLSPELLERTGKRVGDQVDLVHPGGRFTIVGTAEQVDRYGEQAVYAQPGALIGGELEAIDAPHVYVTGRPLRWEDVQRLNAHGIWVYSRAVVLDPPADEDVPLHTRTDAEMYTPSVADRLAPILVGVLVVGLAALEVALLAGAAFAVGARRQARALGLLAATGGEARHVRRVVLAGGLVLGLTAAVLAVPLGILGAAAAMPILEPLSQMRFGHFDVRPLEILGIVALGVGTGLAAAALPARTASRQDPVKALRGQRGQVRTRKRVPVIAVVVTAVGAGTAAVGSALAVASGATGPGVSDARALLIAGLIAGGAGLSQLGLIALSPAIIALAARLARPLPVAPRMALRDAARHRGRSAPAVAAILAAVTGSVALSLYVASIEDSERRGYRPAVPIGSGGVALAEHATSDDGTTEITVHSAAEVARVLDATLPVRTATVVRAADDDCIYEDVCAYASVQTPPQHECPLWTAEGQPTPEEIRAAETDWRCDEQAYGGYSTVTEGTLVGDAGALRALFGTTSGPAEDVLRAGGIVVTDRRLVHDGKVTIAITDTGKQPEAELEAGIPARTFTVPAAVLDAPVGPAQLWSPGAARRAGSVVRDASVLATFDRLSTQAEEDAATEALRKTGIPAENLYVERGYESEYGLGLLGLVGAAAAITLGAAGIATGLAQADSRPDHATLAAIGAEPRLRRRLAAAQALSIAGLGTVLGIAAGFVPAVAFIAALPRLELAIPWVNLALILAGIPALAAGFAFVFTRSRLPLERRIAV